MVNEVAAERYWPGQDPIGKRLRLGDASGAWLEIVGVAKTGKYGFLVERPTPFLYVPYAQHPRARMTLLMESAGDPSTLAAPLRESLRDLDPAMPVYSIRTLQYTWDKKAVDPSRLLNEMVAAMGGMGVLLALTGLYGLMAYSVSTRRREIGIRMAIGAAKNDVLGMILRQGFVLAGTGTAVGLLLSAGANRLLVAAFPSMRNSVITYLFVIPTVFGVTMLAAFLPARRASLVQPVSALRQD
jgi:predicted lysophospholipase L1 biosynthesis ABC-type transport system permease subunit